ncbi:MAG: hypothetical protein GXX86_06055 [Propionibacterium sp.]|nr:hypothetical protein [Propionibacterium sp.]
MRARVLPAVAVLLVTACAAGPQDPAARTERAAELLVTELGTDKVQQVSLTDTLLSLRSADTEVQMEIGDDHVEQQAVAAERRHELTSRPLSDFDLTAMRARQDELSCAEGYLPVVQSFALAGGAMLQRAGCAGFMEYDVQRTELDGAELGPIDEWSAETIDEALEVAGDVMGDEAVSLQFTIPNPSSPLSGSDWYNLRMEGPAGPGGCSIKAIRFGGRDNDDGTGYLFTHCDDRETVWTGKPAFRVADVDGAQVVAAWAELSERMTDDLDYVWVEAREDGVLLLSTFGAADDIRDIDHRVPLG